MNSLIRAASRLVLKPAQMSRPIVLAPRASNQFMIMKNWAHNFPLTYDFARERIMLVLHLFDKIDPNKLNLESHFYNDLGLDSLDHVEIIMMLEDEFLFEIPDKDAEHLLKPSDILRYITDKEEAYKELQDLHAHDDHHGHHEHEHKLNHSHGEHAIGSSGHNNNHSATQRREFSSWTARLYAESDEVYPTTFREDPPTQIKIEDIEARVMKVCSRYDKIDSSKLTATSHFVDDLGLDSLDHVEIVMELEDEFGLEIPDQDAEKLMRPGEIVKYIYKKEEARAQGFDDRPF